MTTKARSRTTKQDYGTPPEFLAAITRQFGAIDWDLACDTTNMVAPRGFTLTTDALKQDWATSLPPSVRVAFCNPPFADIRPWAKKCRSVRWLRRWTLLLVPYSAGSLWWADHVLNLGMAYGVPRMQFVGADDLYPKDLGLVAYGYGVAGVGFWDWRKETQR